MANHIDLTLIRYGSIPGVGTPGELRCDGTAYKTIEPEWQNNEPFKSCIPTGRYELVPYSSNKYPNVYALKNHALGVYVHQEDIPIGVKGRYAILIHIANLAVEVVGCIGPGIRSGYTTIKDGTHGFGVLSSTAAVRQLKATLDKYEVRHIDIQEVIRNW